MPAVFLLLRTLVIRLLSSRLAGSVAQFLRRTLSSGAAHLSTALRHVWDRLRSQESKEAVLGCVLLTRRRAEGSERDVNDFVLGIIWTTETGHCCVWEPAMSESIVRKVQPFTIGTRLSVPTKCQDFTPNYLQSSSLDNCTLQHNLNSLYLSRSAVCAHGPQGSPVLQTPVRQEQEDMAAEDQLNQNIASAAAVARSIKKITISVNGERAEHRTAKRTACVFVPGATENNNNNNNITDQSFPRIVGVSCENKPKSQFKVLLRRESCNEQTAKAEQPSPHQVSSPDSESQGKDILPVAAAEGSAGDSSQSDSFTQRNSLFNKEVLQAEAWIRGKLQDLKDGRNINPCTLKDWDEACQTLQRDLKDFENTLIQLNQMGEQLICKMNPTADSVKKRLSHLRDLWQTLKQTAANQTKTLCGAKSLQEFNAKVEKLEAWIKEKEEPTSLANILGESVDKMQLTRRILDLKQDEQLYRHLYEEINHLAFKLEKQGKADGKNVSNQRKHVNKMYTWSFEMSWWLRVQAQLKNYHENLQLALEVSSFYQQADTILLAIHNMRKDASKELDKLGDQEVQDIAGQIMMLDVSASRLSNLHPTLTTGVLQKQSELKESWALLQNTLSPTAPRDEGDPSTREQCTVGTELQRTMGKEVKEEQNRLKGFVSAADCTGQAQEQDSAFLSSPMGEAAVCANDVIARLQLKGESRKLKTEPKNDTAQPGHPPLPVQLQKFTVSADKTLSWLKDNVSLATQICSMASGEGLEAARKCQHALEQEILNNRTRIEVVKREGRGLVRAQHPGSSRIQEFLCQLEVLWDELRRRHQRNALFLQASEELGFRVVKVLQALGSLDAWLESVELSMKESSLAADPETMSAAERQSCLLEREVTARGLELSALRQEVERLHCHTHPLTRELPTRMHAVERKYQRVQSALTQQSSELQDTRMLAEFLEQVELEESQFNPGQPLHSEMSPAPTLLELRGRCESLLGPLGDPTEELREAVEMLNDTVRERGRSLNHDSAVRELLSKHASLAVRVEESLSRSKDLSLDILEKQTDMAVQCEPEHCGLDALWEEQDHLEIDYEVIGEEVKAVESRATRLEQLCPERVHVFGTKIQATLGAWAELGASVKENKSRLREFERLQDFFRSYLQMISWTEDTRSCIFSDTAMHLGKDGEPPIALELDLQIEQKFEEFEVLAATGRNILDKEHHLCQMVGERMEELRSMLGWISVHWRAQKQQWLQKQEEQDNVYSIMCSSLAKPEAREQQEDQSVYSLVLSSDDEKQHSSALENSFVSCPNKPTEEAYQVMKSVPLPSADLKSPESPKSSVFVLKDKSSPGLGNTVNLILSFGNTGNSQVQVLGEDEETSEPLRRVSTYLHVKDSSFTSGPVYENITLPRLKSHSASSAYTPSPPRSPSTLTNASQTTNFHLPTSGTTSIFSSLKRIGKRRKRKRDIRRHSIQKIIGVEEQEHEDSVDSGVSSLGSVKLSSDIPSLDNPSSKAFVGKVVSLDVGCIPNTGELGKANVSSEFESEAVHVDHQQFEEVEEELEGIWSQHFRNSICSDIMYQPSQEDTLSVIDQPVQLSPPSKSPSVFFRDLVTTSAPNLLVAEFKLPPSVQSRLGYDKNPSRHLSSLGAGERRSWAAFTNREPVYSCSSGTTVAVNETASDPLKLPAIEDSQRYIYHYREEEEEEEEEEKDEEAREEGHTGCPKGVEGSCQQTSELMGTQHHTTATRERCFTLRPEQSMEGPLERKQRLQLGGKKAASRGWSCFHTVLYRHTLCFYQDKKDILRSSSGGLPLNLIGAECVPAPEYTKKPNCFQLRLRDGSEYLLNASSRPLMKKWITKIQANTGRLEAGSLTSELCSDVDHPFSVTSSPHEVTSTFPRIKPRGPVRPALLLTDFSHEEEEQDPSSTVGVWGGEDDISVTQADSEDAVCSQRRSHSFTSATYQKISPVLSPGARSVERGALCVTLLLGDKSQDVPCVSHGDAPMMDEDRGLRSYTSLPRPRNQSVFKKFFGRKDD
uniref:PH domain-containing protein n=1 Tax=Knipowitschia caucasica TaxID=637954 RepID=A0AAV2JRM6_KNICA